jgi:hypothetical protein
MFLYRRIKHLIWLYRDLSEHKRHGRIKDFKINWNSYDVLIQNMNWEGKIHLEL